MPTRQPCPRCAAPARLARVGPQRWWVCPGCGNASRAPRPGEPDGRAGWWTDIEGRADAHRGEVPIALELLARAGVTVAGDVLEIGGGPGFVAAALASRARRVVLTEYVDAARVYASERLGLDARVYAFGGPPLRDAVDGAFDLILCRYALGWCADLPRLAAELRPVAAPGATLVLAFVTPSQGALLCSAWEELPPLTLWSPDHVERTFAAAGWTSARRFEALPPMHHGQPHGRAWRLRASLWARWPGPLPRDPMQRHAGLVLRYGDPSKDPPCP